MDGMENPYLLLNLCIKNKGDSNSTLHGVAGRHPKGFCGSGGCFPKVFPKGFAALVCLTQVGLYTGREQLFKLGFHPCNPVR